MGSMNAWIFLCYSLLLISSFLGLILLGLVRRTRMLEYQLKEAIRQLNVRRVSRGKR